MIKRVLVLFRNEGNRKSLLNVANYFKNNLNAEVTGLYVRDIRKYEFVYPSVESYAFESSMNLIMDEIIKLEEKTIENLKDDCKEVICSENMIVSEGITGDVVLEKMKGFDLLILAKGEQISGDLKNILREHYKPIIIIPDSYGTDFKVEEIIFTNDNSIRSNFSFFSFLNYFNKNNLKISSVSVNIKDISKEFIKYIEINKLNVNFKNISGNTIKTILEESENKDLLIMGDLRYSYTLEKITGHTGVKLVEQSKIPIYIA